MLSLPHIWWLFVGLFIFQVVLGLDRNPNPTVQATLPYRITLLKVVHSAPKRSVVLDMDSLRHFVDLVQSVAKLVPIVGPRYLGATMPALQDAAFVASLAWSVYIHRCPLLSQPH